MGKCAMFTPMQIFCMFEKVGGCSGTGIRWSDARIAPASTHRLAMSRLAGKVGKGV